MLVQQNHLFVGKAGAVLTAASTTHAEREQDACAQTPVGHVFKGRTSFHEVSDVQSLVASQQIEVLLFANSCFSGFTASKLDLYMCLTRQEPILLCT